MTEPRHRPRSHRAVPRADLPTVCLRAAGYGAAGAGVLAYPAGLSWLAGALLLAGAGLLCSQRALTRARELRARAGVRAHAVFRVGNTRPHAVDG